MGCLGAGNAITFVEIQLTRAVRHQEKLCGERNPRHVRHLDTVIAEVRIRGSGTSSRFIDTELRRESYGDIDKDAEAKH